MVHFKPRFLLCADVLTFTAMLSIDACERLQLVSDYSNVV